MFFRSAFISARIVLDLCAASRSASRSAVPIAGMSRSMTYLGITSPPRMGSDWYHPSPHQKPLYHTRSSNFARQLVHTPFLGPPVQGTERDATILGDGMRQPGHTIRPRLGHR